MRPAYFAFKLLSRLAGERLRLETPDPAVHALASWDPKLKLYNILLWNFSPTPAQVNLTIEGGPKALVLQRLVLDGRAPSDDENVRLKPQAPREFNGGQGNVWLDLEAYGVNFLSLEAPL